jgi:hypothetical protein
MYESANKEMNMMKEIFRMINIIHFEVEKNVFPTNWNLTHYTKN